MTFWMLATLMGGVALLLYGIRLAGEGLQKAAGGRLRSILTSLTRNRLVGVGVGALITAILQSSSATTVMLVGLVSAGILGLKQTIGVILGADIGTTFTVQLLAFRVHDLSILVIGIGIWTMFLARRAWVRDVGQAILGFGFVFFAIKLISSTMAPIKDAPWVQSTLLQLGETPWMGILVAALLAALIQSSAAVISLALALALQDMMTLELALPVIFGANIGTCVTALVSSIGANVEARQVAAAHTLFKVIGVLLFYPFLDPFAELVRYSASDVARQIANAHTFFNVGIALLFLPIAGWFADLIRWLVPERPGEEPFGPRYLDERVLSSPPLALGQATREALRMADIVQWMLKQSIVVFQKNDRDLIDQVQQRDDEVDLLDREIKRFLTRLVQERLTPEQSRKELELIAFSSNLENMGDIIDKNLMELARKKVHLGVAFSEEGFREIVDFHAKVLENFELAITAFASRDRAIAQKVLRHKTGLGEIERQLRQAHIDRLHRGLQESMDTSAIHLDILSNLKRINSHITNLVYPILEEGEETQE